MTIENEAKTPKLKVLCAEDEIEIRDTISEILRDEGFEVFEANNGKEAFELYTEHKPHVIISDIMMPEVDGYALLKLVRESRDKNNNVPFIFLSALGQKENIVKGVSLSANDYLIKPIDFEILIAKVKEKATSAMKLQKAHETGIKNIKTQISTILPSEVSSYLDSITQIAQVLKEQPYGPLPHRKYLDGLNKIYFDAIKLKSAITNALDHNVIDSRLNANEEVFSLCNFIEHAIENLPEKIKNRVEFERPYESEMLPKVKMDKSILIDVIKKIIAGVVKHEQDSTISVSIISDSMNNMVVIFYLKSKLGIEKVSHNIDAAKIEELAGDQSCYFRIEEKEGGQINATLSIPSHRLVA